MPHRTIRIAAAAVAALGLLTACGGGKADGGNTPSQAPASSSATGGGSGPKVPAALPTKDLLGDNPCKVLTDAETSDFGLVVPGKTLTGDLPGCQWRSADNGQNSIGMRVVQQNKNGISDIYDQKARQAYFEPVTVDGYPGVLADTQDGRPSGTCTLWLGVTDQLSVSIIPAIGAGPNKSNPCGLAQKFAGAVVKHLKAA
ncbi:DUF3558 domain-containing protein [Amycolatopsis sp. VS8301801F10]|uniref:DUF3558 domain-containing protein n=1 Tax=unclassified Amycolatopsis TaxID=2618356 RepID=UPI0038FC8D95